MTDTALNMATVGTETPGWQYRYTVQQRGVQHVVQHETGQQAVQHRLKQAVQHIVRHGPGVPPRRAGGVAGRGGAGSASVLPGAVNTVL